jgi:PPOX class probable F420-dependent enzyme
MVELDEKAKKLLKGNNFVFLATVNADGTPHLTPTWVDTDGENVLINTAQGRRKLRNIDTDKRVAVGVFDISNPYEHLTIQGTVVKKITGKEAEDHVDKMAKKYMGKDSYPFRAPGEKRVLLVIRPLKTYQ